jgi:hypothetical protein
VLDYVVKLYHIQPMLEDDEDMSELFGPTPDPVVDKIARAQAAVVPKGKREPQIRVGRLDNLEAIGAEAAKLYRKARVTEGHDIGAVTGQRLATILKVVADLVQAGELARFEEIEARLAELEASQKGGRK